MAQLVVYVLKLSVHCSAQAVVIPQILMVEYDQTFLDYVLENELIENVVKESENINNISRYKFGKHIYQDNISSEYHNIYSESKVSSKS